MQQLKHSHGHLHVSGAFSVKVDNHCLSRGGTDVEFFREVVGGKARGEFAPAKKQAGLPGGQESTWGGCYRSATEKKIGKCTLCSSVPLRLVVFARHHCLASLVFTSSPEDLGHTTRIYPWRRLLSQHGRTQLPMQSWQCTWHWMDLRENDG